MELREFLNGEGAGRINVVAINWTESLYGESPARMRRFIDIIHPGIKVVRGAERTGVDFGGLGYVPVSFVFGRDGTRLFGDGGRSPVSIERLKKILDGAN